MRKLLIVLALAGTACAPGSVPNPEIAAWEAQAQRVTIRRDDWGIPHVSGATDADAVFGLMYAQAEDDFNRIETNYLNAMGRLAEAEGEAEIWRDLRMKLFIAPAKMKALYQEAPDWLEKLMDAWADGLNFYLHTHPEVTPRVLGRFEPWMALAFSEGSIGGDIERVSLEALEAFYEDRPEPGDSSERAAWMHTSSGVDNIDEYLETVVERPDGLYYRYGNEERPLAAEQITLPHRTDAGLARRELTVYRTHHGPIVRRQDDKWVSVRLMAEPLKALIQSYTRTKARNHAEFVETLRLHTNSSNNTVFADADGNIAYFHSNFIPARDPRFDWSRPVDGSDPRSEWGELLSVEETPGVLNPAAGWIQNTNNWPFSVSGPDSPKREDYPSYVESHGENARGLHAIRVLENRTDFTLEALIAAAFDSYLPAFAETIPALVRAWDETPAANQLKTGLAEPIELLRQWDHRWSAESVPTTLAIFWAEELRRQASEGGRRAGEPEATMPRQQLAALQTATAQLQADFGTWKTPWGEINRFQRLTGEIVQPFSDAGPSLPVGFTSARWGALASFGARAYPGTKKWYGTSGNSFVAVVELGDRVRARAVTAGGLSSDPASPHFNDQGQRYVAGDLREVYFYPEQLQGHVEREYHPGR